MDKKIFGKRIKDARKLKEWSSEKLAEQLNLNATFLRQIESGSALPSLPVFVRICNVLQISSDALLHGNLEVNELDSCVALKKVWDNATPREATLILISI